VLIFWGKVKLVWLFLFRSYQFIYFLSHFLFKSKRLHTQNNRYFWMFETKMKRRLYNIDPKELILRDHLAIDRTKLANERNFLAFVRTALAFVAGGFGLIKFVDELAYIVIGWILVGIGAIVLGFGFYRYLKFKKVIDSMQHPEEESTTTSN